MLNPGEATIWYPGIYHGRTEDEYTQQARNIPLNDLVAIVQKRAQEDGEWTISHGLVGDNEDKMRRMMEFVADEKNIRQCAEYIRKEKAGVDITVDWVCRDLANASKVMIR